MIKKIICFIFAFSATVVSANGISNNSYYSSGSSFLISCSDLSIKVYFKDSKYSFNIGSGVIYSDISVCKELNKSLIKSASKETAFFVNLLGLVSSDEYIDQESGRFQECPSVSNVCKLIVTNWGLDSVYVPSECPKYLDEN
jgi:hypothetical protein